MARQLSPRVQFVGSFIAALALAYWFANRDNGEEQIRSQIYSHLGSVCGLLVGSKLIERKKRSN